MCQYGYRRENSIASKFRTDFNEQLESRKNEVPSMLHYILSLASSISDSDCIQEPSNYDIYSATIDVVQLEILKPFTQIYLDMTQSAKPMIYVANATPNYPHMHNTKTPDDQTQPPRARTAKCF